MKHRTDRRCNGPTDRLRIILDMYLCGLDKHRQECCHPNFLPGCRLAGFLIILWMGAKDRARSSSGAVASSVTACGLQRPNLVCE